MAIPPLLNHEALSLLYEAAKEFVRKVEAGEARSKRSYAQFKLAVAVAESESAIHSIHEAHPHKYL